MNCPARREGDEVMCPTCGLRWSLSDDRPECPRDAVRRYRETFPAIAAQWPEITPDDLIYDEEETDPCA